MGKSKKSVRNAAKHRPKGSSKSKGKKSIRYNFFANPGKKKKSGKRNHRPRSVSNPSMRSRRRAGSALVSMVIAILRLGGVAWGAGFAVREGTQMVLQSRNTGWMGYAGNFVATGLAMWLAKMFGTRADVIAAAAGGGVAIANRYTSSAANPVLESMSLSGLGDVSTFTARNSIRSALRGLPAPAAPSGAPAAAPAPSMVTYRPPQIRTMNGAH